MKWKTLSADKFSMMAHRFLSNSSFSFLPFFPLISALSWFSHLEASPPVSSCLHYAFPLHYVDWQICNSLDTCAYTPVILYPAICAYARACKVSLKNITLACLITPPYVFALTPIREKRQWMKRQSVVRPTLSLGAILIISKADVGYLRWILGN